MTGARRFSQAISEGDGISVVVHVEDTNAARVAEEQGAEALAVRSPVDAVGDATSLAVLWRPHGSPEEAHSAQADACVLSFAELREDEGGIEGLYRQAIDLGLDCAIEVRDEEELQAALERLDPEIFLLAGNGDDGPLRWALDLLHDVPAGKLAVADLAGIGREEVAELERAGMDAVIVAGGNVAELVGGSPPDV